MNKYLSLSGLSAQALVAKPMGLRELRAWLHTSAGDGPPWAQNLRESAG